MLHGVGCLMPWNLSNMFVNLFNLKISDVLDHRTKGKLFGKNKSLATRNYTEIYVKNKYFGFFAVKKHLFPESHIPFCGADSAL
jgi:hypothetical protein